MGHEPTGSRGPDYRVARIGAALAFTLIVVVLLLLDALRADYVVDHIVLTLLLGTILGLLGLEAAKIIRGPR